MQRWEPNWNSARVSTWLFQIWTKEYLNQVAGVIDKDFLLISRQTTMVTWWMKVRPMKTEWSTICHQTISTSKLSLWTLARPYQSWDNRLRSKEKNSDDKRRSTRTTDFPSGELVAPDLEFKRTWAQPRRSPPRRREASASQRCRWLSVNKERVLRTTLWTDYFKMLRSGRSRRIKFMK